MGFSFMKAKSLYIHIPFCEHICAYCDFTKLLTNDKFIDSYMPELYKEIDSYNIDKVNTLYIGGGTPTAIDDTHFEELLKKVSKYLDKDYEFTVEANVENLTKEKLLLMKKYGVNRVSIGVESSNDEILKKINRHHTFKDAIDVVYLAKSLGFTNINVDLIYGLQDQNIDEELNNFISLDVPHISIYSLSVSQGSMFYNLKVKPLNEEEDAKAFERIHEFMESHGYIHYEISNFAIPGHESRHNMVYWKDQEYYGCGLGASGYLNGVRYGNTPSLPIYLEGNYISYKETLTKEDEEIEYLMLGFRLKDGFKREDYKARFGVDFLENYQKNIKRFKLDEHMVISETEIKPKFSFMEKLDSLLLLLMYGND